MRHPRDWTMNHKILLSTVAAVLAAIGIVAVFLIGMEQRTMGVSTRAAARTLVHMIASNAPTALIYDDRQVAQQILTGAKSEPTTVVAALYRADGTLYAWVPDGYPRPSIPARPAAASRAAQEHSFLDTFEPVVTGGRTVGIAFLRTDLVPMRQRFHLYILSVAAVAALAVLVIVILSRVLRTWLSDPLEALARSATLIAQQQDYSVRAAKVGDDEVGKLVDAFNFMVTEIDRAHEQITRYAANLEKLVEERTAKLSETVSELETFSYSVSHDLRAPLRAIRGYLEIMREDAGPPNATVSGYIERIIRASDRMDQLIQDILSYSQVAQAEMKIEAINLDQLVDDVIADYEQKAVAEWQIERPLGSVMGHRAGLSQVVSNLLANAAKFVPANRKPRISIRAESRDGCRRVYVSDNGIGIRPEDLGRLFHIFQRVGPSRDYPGTGIGLSIVKKALQRMDGQFGVESVPETGSTFWFELKSGGETP